MTDGRTASGRRKVAYNIGHARMSQRQVAKQLGISQGRVMQLEQRALMKLVLGLMNDPVMKQAYEQLLGA